MTTKSNSILATSPLEDGENYSRWYTSREVRRFTMLFDDDTVSTSQVQTNYPKTSTDAWCSTNQVAPKWRASTRVICGLIFVLTPLIATANSMFGPSSSDTSKPTLISTLP